MNLKLERFRNDGDCVIGKLYADGKFEAFTLEPLLDNKVAIPVGKYRVTLEHSPRLGFVTPRLHKVPQHEGILIHSGNYPKDSLGCILVGKTEGHSFVGSSRLAFYALMDKLQQQKDEMYIEIENAKTLKC